LLSNIHHIHQHHHSQHQRALTTYSALGAEEFPRRDEFATRNERHKRQTHEGYDEILQPIDNDRS